MTSSIPKNDDQFEKTIRESSRNIDISANDNKNPQKEKEKENAIKNLSQKSFKRRSPRNPTERRRSRRRRRHSPIVIQRHEEFHLVEHSHVLKPHLIKTRMKAMRMIEERIAAVRNHNRSSISLSSGPSTTAPPSGGTFRAIRDKVARHKRLLMEQIKQVSRDQEGAGEVASVTVSQSATVEKKRFANSTRRLKKIVSKMQKRETEDPSPPPPDVNSIDIGDVGSSVVLGQKVRDQHTDSSLRRRRRMNGGEEEEKESQAVFPTPFAQTTSTPLDISRTSAKPLDEPLPPHTSSTEIHVDGKTPQSSHPPPQPPALPPQPPALPPQPATTTPSSAPDVQTQTQTLGRDVGELRESVNRTEEALKQLGIFMDSMQQKVSSLSESIETLQRNQSNFQQSFQNTLRSAGQQPPTAPPTTASSSTTTTVKPPTTSTNSLSLSILIEQLISWFFIGFSTAFAPFLSIFSFCRKHWGKLKSDQTSTSSTTKKPRHHQSAVKKWLASASGQKDKQHVDSNHIHTCDDTYTSGVDLWRGHYNQLQ